MTREERLERYASGPDAVSRALDGIDVSAAPDGWTPREVVHHLADLTVVAAGRLRRLIAEDRPAIPDVDEARYARDLHYERPMEASLALFRAAVVSNVDLLRALRPEEWERSGEHSEFGEYSIDYWLERQADHVHEHAEQIARCKR
jgi:hypothetical protein